MKPKSSPKNGNVKPRRLGIREFAVIIIVILIALIVGIYDKIQKNKTKEAEKITKILLDHHEISFAANGIVSPKKLEEINKMSYNQLKKSLGTNADFCLIIESAEGEVIFSKGYPSLIKDGIACGE